MNIPQDSTFASAPEARAPLPDRSVGSFIVNLCALTEPAVPQPPPGELEALRAFVSRRTKDGIDRFYLHVGFFQTQVEAEEWLSTARTTYPKAFVSKLADTLRPSDAGAPPVADTQVLRVLEARAPRSDGESGETGTYAVQSEARLLGTPPTPAAAAPMSAPVSQAAPAKPPAAANVPKTTRPADVWNAFVASEAGNDSSSSSGVRHLRVEIQRPRKPSKPRKR